MYDLARPFFNTGQTISMDNFYTSPECAILLRENGLYLCGMLRGNQMMLPKWVLISKAEAKSMPHGYYRQAVCKDKGMAVFSWNDGSPVHILTTADGTERDSVKQCIGTKCQKFAVPIAVPRYNHGMQAIDCFDQLMKLFSLAQHHIMKKYYHKLFLILIDFALVNAWIHFCLTNNMCGRVRQEAPEQILSQTVLKP